MGDLITLAPARPQLTLLDSDIEVSSKGSNSSPAYNSNTEGRVTDSGGLGAARQSLALEEGEILEFGNTPSTSAPIQPPPYPYPYAYQQPASTHVYPYPLPLPLPPIDPAAYALGFQAGLLQQQVRQRPPLRRAFAQRQGRPVPFHRPRNTDRPTYPRPNPRFQEIHIPASRPSPNIDPRRPPANLPPPPANRAQRPAPQSRSTAFESGFAVFAPEYERAVTPSLRLDCSETLASPALDYSYTPASPTLDYSDSATEDHPASPPSKRSKSDDGSYRYSPDRSLGASYSDLDPEFDSDYPFPNYKDSESDSESDSDGLRTPYADDFSPAPEVAQDPKQPPEYLSVKGYQTTGGDYPILYSTIDEVKRLFSYVPSLSQSLTWPSSNRVYAEASPLASATAAIRRTADDNQSSSSLLLSRVLIRKASPRTKEYYLDHNFIEPDTDLDTPGQWDSFYSDTDSDLLDEAEVRDLQETYSSVRPRTPPGANKHPLAGSTESSKMAPDGVAMIGVMIAQPLEARHTVQLNHHSPYTGKADQNGSSRSASKGPLPPKHPFDSSSITSPYSLLLSRPSPRSTPLSSLPGMSNPSLLQSTIMRSWCLAEPDNVTQNTRKRLLEKLTIRINSQLGGVVGGCSVAKGERRFEVDVFGSVSWGGETGESGDIDLVVLDKDQPQGYHPSLWRTPPEEDATGGASKGSRQRVIPISSLPQVYDLNKLARVLRSMGMLDVVPIHHASTPIIKFKYVDGAEILDCDININDLGGWYNSALILRYCDISPNVLRPMIHVLKKWATAQSLNDPSGAKGPSTMSSYCLTLMAIGYLQHRGHLPNLQADISVPVPSFPADVDDPDLIWVALGKQQGTPAHIAFAPTPPASWRQKEVNLTVEDAIRGFFSFFSTNPVSPSYPLQFSRTTHIISVLNGGIVPRADPIGQPLAYGKDARIAREPYMGKGDIGIQPANWRDRRIVVQDPFIWQKNCTQAMSATGLTAWMNAVNFTDARLRSKGSSATLDDICYKSPAAMNLDRLSGSTRSDSSRGSMGLGRGGPQRYPSPFGVRGAPR